MLKGLFGIGEDTPTPEDAVENGVNGWAEKRHGSNWQEYVAYTVRNGVRHTMVVPPWAKEEFVDAMPHVLRITPVKEDDMCGVYLEYDIAITAETHQKYGKQLQEFASKFCGPLNIRVQIPDTVESCHCNCLVCGAILFTDIDEDKVQAALDFFRWVVYDVGLAMEFLYDGDSDAALNALLSKDYHKAEV